MSLYDTINGFSNIIIDTDLRISYRVSRASFSQTYYDDISGFVCNKTESLKIEKNTAEVKSSQKTKVAKLETET